MLEVDLGLLRRDQRLPIDVEVPAEHAMWQSTGVSLDGPLGVRLTVEQAGADVVVRGTLAGRARLGCRRCLQTVQVPVREEVTFLYQSGVDAVEAEREEVYPLPSRARTLDLTGAIREHVVLVVPQYAICDEACLGLCSRCGSDLNLAPCACADEVMDTRWAALRRHSAD